VPPTGIRVGEALAFRAVLRDLPHPVCVARKVRGINGNVAAHLRVHGSERSGAGIEASVQGGAVLTKLRCEAIGGPLGRGIAECCLQAVVFRDQSSGSAPSRDSVERLDDAGSEQGARPIALAPPFKCAGGPIGI
jgi:hypothetical protein